MAENKTVRGSQATAHRRGQALVEFAIISFVLSAIVAGLLGIMVLALGSFQNNIAAESAGRILDEHPRFTSAAFDELYHSDSTINPYTATASQVMELLTYDDAVFNAKFGQPLYHDRHLVLSPDEWENRSGLPALNQLLIPSYVYDPDLNLEGESSLGAYRYPGAVVEREGEPDPITGDQTKYKTVLVPLLSIAGVEPCNDGECQCESDYWVAPLRICKILDCDCSADPPEASNPIGSEPTFTMSLVYPSQPASMVSIETIRDEEGNILRDEEGNFQYPVEADDATVATKYANALATLPGDYTFADLSRNSAYGASSSRGKFGLGETNAFLTKVRPYRRVFESRTVFRLRFGTMTAKYQADGSVISLVDASEEEDQFLNFGEQVMDREPSELSLVIPEDPPGTAFDDFDYRALQVPSMGDGVWRITAASEFAPDNSWDVDEEEVHILELRLYRNGVQEQVIASEAVSSRAPGDSGAVQLVGQAVVDADPGDKIQVRVHTALPDPASASYDVQLTGSPERNWVTYEFLGAR